jgi:hypothetical protein
MLPLFEDLRGLTLIQPMGWALFHGRGGAALGPGLKDVENREWAPKPELVGEVIAIHGGKTYDAGYEELILDLLGLESLPPEARATGILGLVTIDRVISGGILSTEGKEAIMRRAGWERHTPVTDPAFRSPWYCGSRGWVLRDQVLFRQPVPCRGNRTLWPVPAEVRPLIEAAHAEALGA